jgi:cytochrome c peroxidase
MKKSSVTILFFLIITSLITAETIDLENLFNYENQTKPAYITKDNTNAENVISDKTATLGRVLFYDKKLSLNNTIACANCHQQEFAFSDTSILSKGLNGELTGRHSMRLINARFSQEIRFFWDERALTLEDQTTRPIQDHVEMGFSGTNNNPGIDSLINRLNQITYYQQLFNYAFGNPEISEEKIQKALAQFVRSIQSFDSKFDIGRSQVPNLGAPFPNFTTEENAGKQLFLNPPAQNGAGCQGCHRAPEFDIDPNSRNNGVVQAAGNTSILDLTNTRAPTLRDIFNPSGDLNGPLMHNGAFTTINQVIDHYNLVPNNPNNTNLDLRLAGPGGNLQLSQGQKNQLIAFLRTLTGNDVYTNPKWSDPFDLNGDIEIVPIITSLKNPTDNFDIQIYPNPANNNVSIVLPNGESDLHIYNINGQLILSKKVISQLQLDISSLEKGIYFFSFQSGKQQKNIRKFVKL